MKNTDYQKTFDFALESLKGRSEETDAPGFEHDVWSEIALRDEHSARGWFRWFQSGKSPVSAPVAASFAVVAIAAGGFLGLAQAEAYGKQASRSMEQRYVESIHPVMMSANHASDSDHQH